nr:hypothetical protein [Tanacetum cinerariifolium]
MWNFMQNLHDGPPVPPPGEEKEPEATTDTELSSAKDIQPLSVQEPPQNSDIRQLIREECSTEVSEQHEVKNVVKQPVERRNRNIQSLQNFRVVHKSSISNTSQISSIHAVAPILSTKEPGHLLSMGYEHLSITLEMESDEVTESNAENLLPISSKCDVTLEDEIEFDMPAKDVCSPVSLLFQTLSSIMTILILAMTSHFLMRMFQQKNSKFIRILFSMKMKSILIS